MAEKPTFYRDGSPGSGPGLFAALRRYPVLVLVPVLLGLALGGAFTLLRHATFQAQAQVLIGDSNDVTVYRDSPPGAAAARGQAAAVTMRSPAVASRASDLLGHHVTPRAVKSSVTVAPVADAAVVTISATSDDAQRAADIANAVATAYDDVTKSTADKLGQRVDRVLSRQMTAARAQLDAVQGTQEKRANQIGKKYADALPSERDRLIQLTLGNDVAYQGLVHKAERLSDTVSALRESLIESRVDTQMTTQGTNTLYPANRPADRFKATLVRNLLVGGILGLLLGAVLAWRRLEREGAWGARPLREAEHAPEAADESSPRLRRAERRGAY